MMTKMATRRLVRKTALKLLTNGVSVPLPDLQRIIERTLRKEMTRSAIPPEVALDTRLTTRNLALETAMQLYQAMEDAKTDAERAMTGWKGPDILEQLFKRMLNLLQASS